MKREKKKTNAPRKKKKKGLIHLDVTMIGRPVKLQLMRKHAVMKLHEMRCWSWKTGRWEISSFLSSIREILERISFLITGHFYSFDGVRRQQQHGLMTMPLVSQHNIRHTQNKWFAPRAPAYPSFKHQSQFHRDSIDCIVQAIERWWIEPSIHY